MSAGRNGRMARVFGTSAALVSISTMRRSYCSRQLRGARVCALAAMRALSQGRCPGFCQHSTGHVAFDRRASLAKCAGQQPRARRLHSHANEARWYALGDRAHDAASTSSGTTGSVQSSARRHPRVTSQNIETAAPAQAKPSRAAATGAAAFTSLHVDHASRGGGAITAQDPYAAVLHADVIGDGGAAVLPATLAAWLPSLRRHLTGVFCGFIHSRRRLFQL